MKIQQHIYDMERKRKHLRNAQDKNRRQRPKAKSNLQILQQWTVSQELTASTKKQNKN